MSVGVTVSVGVNMSVGVNVSLGVNRSWGVNGSWGCLNCEGISSCIFCSDFTGKLAIFNKQVDEVRYNDVKQEIYSFDWYPAFNNLKSLYLKNGNKWECTPIPQAKEILKQEAWADIPQALLSYIKSLPEFDAVIFEEITGIR